MHGSTGLEPMAWLHSRRRWQAATAAAAASPSRPCGWSSRRPSSAARCRSYSSGSLAPPPIRTESLCVFECYRGEAHLEGKAELSTSNAVRRREKNAATDGRRGWRSTGEACDRIGRVVYFGRGVDDVDVDRRPAGLDGAPCRTCAAGGGIGTGTDRRELVQAQIGDNWHRHRLENNRGYRHRLETVGSGTESSGLAVAPTRLWSCSIDIRSQRRVWCSTCKTCEHRSGPA